jgi:flagellar biosynthesis/type III secretory pathway protein FliH
MAAIIKSGDLASISSKVRPWKDARQAPLPPPTAEPIETLILRQEVERLSRELAQRGVEVEKLRGDVRRAYRDGEDEGRKLGLKAADEGRAARLAALEKGLQDAIGAFSAELSSLERLAALLAREALAKILGDPTQYVPVLSEAIRHQIEQLESQSIIRILVSREDFADPHELAELVSAIGRSDIDVNVSDELKAGECRFKLTLGSIEVGVRQQWERLSAALSALGGAESAA